MGAQPVWVRGRRLAEALRSTGQGEGEGKLFEKYDLEEERANASYAQLAQELGMAVTDVTNALAWARRQFRQIALERLREMCLSEEEFRREARGMLGWEVR